MSKTGSGPEYHNPVRVINTRDWLQSCRLSQQELGVQRPLVITSPGGRQRLGLDKVFPAASIFSAIALNPTFESCQAAIAFAQPKEIDGVVAIGGGSVMDTAKMVLAAKGTGVIRLKSLLEITAPYPHRLPSIFIPTTHGSASEVTRWGVVWDMDQKQKYSLSHPDLYPDRALLDASLTLSLPLDISLTTVLDALSHSFEAIWNKNAVPRSTAYAVKAICIIMKNVEELKRSPQNLAVRRKLLEASNLAGLAFSNTATAAAHSISYPLTAHFDVPHGIASSLALIPLLKINHSTIRDELKQILDTLSLADLGELIGSIQSIPGGYIKYRLSEWGVKETDLDWLVAQSFTKGRIDNNSVELSSRDVARILTEIY